MTAYNEMTFMPIKLDWCRRNDIDLYVIDNMSDDGTWEWLQSNGVASHRFDTQGAFHLEWLQQEIVKTLHDLKPDWVIYHGADLFFQTDGGIRATIERADSDGYNLIDMECLTFFNTGEQRNHPITSFRHFGSQGAITMIHKYYPDIVYKADDVRFSEHKNIRLSSDGVIINFGQTKRAQEREQTLSRRKRAWELGLNKNYGNHYTSGSDQNWIWDKIELQCIDTSKHLKYYESIL